MPAASARPALAFSRLHASRCRGLTVLELVIAMTVAVLLFGMAVPAYRDAMARAQATDARAALSATLFAAMSEASVLGREIVVCAAENGQCSGGEDWSRGWIAFIDADGDRARSGGERLLREQPRLNRAVRLIGSSGRSRLVFQPFGGNAGSNTSFTLCDRRGPNAAIQLILANSGRLRTTPAPSAPALRCAAGL